MDARLIREAGAAGWLIASTVALALFGSMATIVFAWQISLVVWSVFIEHTDPIQLLQNFAFAAAAAVAKALVAWMQEWSSMRAAAKVKKYLRAKFFESLDRLGPVWLKNQSTAELSLLVNNGLDSLDAYFAKYLPQLIYTALVTPLFLFVIGWADIASAVTLAITIPLIPIFMILIGWATQSVQQQQLKALTRLGQHFLEALRGLTTLRVFGRAGSQVETLKVVGEEYRVRTMKVLRLSFLSGFALELLASLSVALVAVSIGLRLVNGEISLLAGLFVLLLAPEAFLPIRNVGSNFHAAAEGVVASSAVLDVITSSRSPMEIGNKYPVDELVQSGKLTVITGPSGAGKTMRLYEVLQLTNPDSISKYAWMPQVPGLFAGSVSDNIVGPNIPVNSEALGKSMALAALDDVVASQMLGEQGAGLSGGQAQRVSLARAIYRLETTAAYALLLDEPISAVDRARAERIIDALLQLKERGVAITTISHQEQLISKADRIVEVNNA